MAIQATPGSGAAPVSVARGRSAWRALLHRDAILVGALFLLTLCIGIPNLEHNPPLSYDEGYVLQTPHNLLTRGFYGTWAKSWNLPFDTYTSTGPTVLLPVAASFAVFGEGVVQARMVVVIYGALAASAGYALFRLTLSRSLALLAALLLALSLYPYQRSVLGEVPGLFWLLLGCWLWLRAIERGGHTRLLALAGVAWGAAALTKLALGPIVLGGLALCWLRFRFGAKDAHLAPRSLYLPLAAALLPLLLWYGLQAVILGGGTVVDRLATVWTYQPQVAAATPSGILQNALALPTILPQGLLVWMGPTVLVIFSWLLISPTPARTLPAAMWLMFLGFYLVSVGWPRYGFWAVALTAAFTAQLIPLLRAALPTLGQRQRQAVTGVIVAALVAPIALWNWSALERVDASPQEVVSLLQGQVAPQENIGSTEWELVFLLGQEVEVPLLRIATAVSETGTGNNDSAWPETDWVVTGPIGDFLGATTKLVENDAFFERSVVGPYRVFQRTAGPPPGWRWSTAGATAISLALGATIGQSFTADYDVLTEVRLLIAGGSGRSNAPVRLALYADPSGGAPLATATLPGAQLTENKWYTFPIGRLAVTKGDRYFIEVTGLAQPGKVAPDLWYNSSTDLYPSGNWYSNGTSQQGDLYFGVLGHNNTQRRGS